MDSQQQRKNDPHKLNRNEKIFLSILSVLVIYVFIDFYILEDIRKERVTDESSKNVFITQSDYYGAYDKEDYKRFIRYLNNNDNEAIKQLLYSGRVFQIPEGKEAFVVKYDFSTVKIRLKGQTTEIWTVVEAIKLK